MDKLYFVVFFLLGDSTASVFYVSIFRNTFVCSVFIGRVNKKLLVHTTYEDGTECFETSARKIQTKGNRPKERIQHSQHGERVKTNTHHILLTLKEKDV